MTTNTLSFKNLKEKHRECRDSLDENLNLRLHRALSWLQRAEIYHRDALLDEAFIFYWISFNAIYSAERIYKAGISEKDIYSDFFRKINDFDQNQRVYNAIWRKFSDSIRLLIKNRYVFQPYWESLNESGSFWERKFHESQKQFNFAFNRQDTVMILCILFARLYVLRNQLVHGGATWSSSTNRSQVRDGANIVAFLVPIFIDLMIDNPAAKWPPPFYPVTVD